MRQYKQYKNKTKGDIVLMRPYLEGERIFGKVSITMQDAENGSPKTGDMIAMNHGDSEDLWLASRYYFENNYEGI